MQKKKKWIIGLSILGTLGITSAIVGAAVGVSVNTTLKNNSTNNAMNSTIANNSANANKTAANSTTAKKIYNNKVVVMNSNKKANSTTITSSLFPAFASSTSSSTNNQIFSYNGLNYEINADQSTVTLLGFSAASDNTDTLTIPNTINHDNEVYSVTNIAAGAFYDQGLNSVSFNDNLQSIGALAFANNNGTHKFLYTCL